MAAAPRRSPGGSFVVAFAADGAGAAAAELRIPQAAGLPASRTRADWRCWIVAVLRAAGLRVSQRAGPAGDGRLYAVVDAPPARLAPPPAAAMCSGHAGKQLLPAATAPSAA